MFDFSLSWSFSSYRVLVEEQSIDRYHLAFWNWDYWCESEWWRSVLKNTLKSVRLSIAFIKRFELIESHYVRNKSKRAYLSLDIRKMWRHFCKEVDDDLKISMVFPQSKFNNIGFGTPVTDACLIYASLYEEEWSIASDQDQV